MIHAKLTGDVEAIANTRAKPAKCRAAIRSGVRKVVQAGAKTAKRLLLRNRTGLLGKSIGSKVKVYGDKVLGLVGSRVSFRTTLGAVAQKGRSQVFQSLRGGKKAIREGKGKKINVKVQHGLKTGQVLDPSKYAHLVELGHKKGKGKSAAPAYPFVKPAFEESQRTAPGILADELKSKVGG